MVVGMLFGSNFSLVSQASFAADAKACKDDNLMYCVAAIGADATLECEDGQRPVDQCEAGDVGRCTWESGSSMEVQWRVYAGSPVLGDAPGICSEGGGQWSTL